MIPNPYDATPSARACVVSINYVLDKTRDVIHPEIRLHLQGIRHYLVAVEHAEAEASMMRQMDVSLATGGPS